MCVIQVAPSTWLTVLYKYPALNMPNSVQGAKAMTTNIIVRFMSSASRTCGGPGVTSSGVRANVSAASKIGKKT